MLQFAKNIQYLRKAQKLTQAKTATALDLTRTTYANYENAGSEPDFETLLRIARFFGIRVDELLTKNLELENFISKRESDKVSTKTTSKKTSSGNYELNETNSILADHQETAIWYLLREVKEIREDVELLKKSVRSKNK